MKPEMSDDEIRYRFRSYRLLGVDPDLHYVAGDEDFHPPQLIQGDSLIRRKPKIASRKLKTNPDMAAWLVETEKRIIDEKFAEFRGDRFDSIVNDPYQENYILDKKSYEIRCDEESSMVYLDPIKVVCILPKGHEGEHEF